MCELSSDERRTGESEKLTWISKPGAQGSVERNGKQHTYLENAETARSLEGEFVAHPVSCTVIIFVKAHQEKGIEGIDDGVSHAA